MNTCRAAPDTVQALHNYTVCSMNGMAGKHLLTSFGGSMLNILASAQKKGADYLVW